MRTEVRLMKRTKRSVAFAWLTCLSVVLALCMGILLDDRASAARKSGKDSVAKLNKNGSKKEKIASDLRENTRKRPNQNGVKIIMQLND